MAVVGGMMSDIWDDPEWEDLRRRVDGQRPLKQKGRQIDVNYEPEQSVEAETDGEDQPQRVEVNLKLSIPKFRLPKIPKLSPKQRKICILCLLILAGLVIAGVVINRLTAKDMRESGTDSVINAVQPPFKNLLPDGKKDSIEGEVKYDPSTQVVSYNDTVGKVLVTVSQQQLPRDFSADPEGGLRKVAEGLTATEILRESHPLVYLGNNPQGSPTVIFHKDGLLVFIVATQYLEKDVWVEYILRLK